MYLCSCNAESLMKVCTCLSHKFSTMCYAGDTRNERIETCCIWKNCDHVCVFALRGTSVQLCCPSGQISCNDYRTRKCRLRFTKIDLNSQGVVKNTVLLTCQYLKISTIFKSSYNHGDAHTAKQFGLSRYLVIPQLFQSASKTFKCILNTVQ